MNKNYFYIGAVLALSLLKPCSAWATEPYEEQQWALANSGHALSVQVDPTKKVEVPGRIGEDIHPLSGPIRSKIVVAVLDTGIDIEHPDLKDSILRKPKECALLEAYRACRSHQSAEVCRSGIQDSDGNGYPLDCHGWNATIPSTAADAAIERTDVRDDLGHGTHVAGILAAAINRSGIRGAAAGEVSLLPVKVILQAPGNPAEPASWNDSNAEGSAFVDTIARGVHYAVQSGARIIQISMAWPAPAQSPLMNQAIAEARARGVVIVAAAGNDATDAPVYPCHSDGVLCVASHGPDGKLSHFSNWGTAVDLSAPGLNILSTWPLTRRSSVFTEEAGFEIKSGTSMAAPFVSAGLAQLLARGFNAREAVARLLLGSRRDGPFQSTLAGRLDVSRASQVAEQALVVPASKEAVVVEWKKPFNELSFRIPLKNIWQSDADVSVQVESNAKEIEPVKKRIVYAQWNAGETRDFPVHIVITGGLVNRIVPLRVTVRTPSKQDFSFLIPVQVRVPVNESYQSDNSYRVPIENSGQLGSHPIIRSVSSGDGDPRQDYVAQVLGPDGVTTLRLLKSERRGRERLIVWHLTPIRYRLKNNC